MIFEILGVADNLELEFEKCKKEFEFKKAYLCKEEGYGKPRSLRAIRTYLTKSSEVKIL